jgi:hypothetical protein
VLIEAIPTVGKNTQQIRAAILKQFKAYEKLLNAFCSSARVEASLIVHVQVGGLPLCLHALYCPSCAGVCNCRAVTNTALKHDCLKPIFLHLALSSTQRLAI